MKPTKGNELNQDTEQLYYEVDIEYTTGAKMVLLGKDEDDIRELITREFADIPNLTIINLALADDELIQEAKARRAFEDASQVQTKKELN